MRTIEFGRENSKVVMLLHGGGLSWWSNREAAQLLGRHFHVVLPILDGHAGSDRPFVSIEDNAAHIIEFIDREFSGSVLLIGGLSLGGQILAEILSQRRDICQLAIIESALVLPMKITYHLVDSIMNMSYGLIKQRWFARLQFRSLGIKSDLYEEYYRDTCLITKKNMTAFLKANARYELKDTLARTQAEVFLIAGQKEQRIMKKSARKMHTLIQESRLEIKKGMRHGEYSINRAEEYADFIMTIACK